MSNNKKKEIEEKNYKFSSIEEAELNYLKKENRFLNLSVFIPVFVLIVQLANILFILFFPPPPPRMHPFNFIPLIVMLTMSFTVIIHYITVRGWQKEIQLYLEFKQFHLEQRSELQEKNGANFPFYSLSRIMYRTVEHIKKLKWSFITINIIFGFYLHWVVKGFIDRTDIHSPPLFLHILNLISQFLLFVYLLLHWNFTLRWIRKERKLKKMEKIIASELEIE